MTPAGAVGSPVAIGASVPTGDTSVADRLDLAVNGKGQAVLVWAANNVAATTYASSSPSSGAAWAAPVAISDTSAGHGGVAPRVAINADGEAIATFVDQTGTPGSYAYYARAVAKPAGSGWPAGAYSAIMPVSFSRSVPVALDSSGRATAVSRNGTTLQVSSRPAGTGSLFSVAESAGTCSNSLDAAGAVTVDAAGGRTILVSCSGSVLALSRPANMSFAGAVAGAQTISLARDTDPRLFLDVTPAGRALAVVYTADSAGQYVAAYRRTTASGVFGSSELLSEPEQTNLYLDGAGIDTNGDAVALVGRARTDTSTGTPRQVVDRLSSVLDVTAPVGGIGGPTTAVTGALVTFTSTTVDPFGGLVGEPAWTSSDGGTGTGPTFVRTFTTPGTYLVTVKQSDGTGAVATAQKTVVVTAPGTNPPPVQPPPVAAGCIVPQVKGSTLKAAKKALTSAGCAVGKVKGPKQAKPASAVKVSKQGVKAGAVVARGAKIALTVKLKKR